MKIKFAYLTALLIVNFTSYATTLNVGSGKTYANPTLAAAAAKPGDTILIHPGNYQGAFFISDLKGTAKDWIVIKGVNKATVVMKAGSEGLHLSDISYVRIQDITFTGQTGNGMNIDDAGSIETPAHHVLIWGCDFKNMGATGNNDFLKLSGLDSFEVAHCSFRNGAAGGSGIDMVGCHFGIVHHCTFDSLGSNSIQMKGGTRFMKIENNTFRNGGQRALNLGGSTGLAYFRPIDAPHEAADISVYANLFIKSQAPIAFVGSERVDVANNTIYMPEKWVIRILQETVDTNRFVPCRNGMFRNNIIYFSGAVTTHVNIGANTAPETFLFSHNLWYNSSNPSSSTPTLPTSEISGIKGQDPKFASPGLENFTLTNSSPAIGTGTPVTWLGNDMKGDPFKNPPSRGAYEFGFAMGIKNVSEPPLRFYPNPFSSGFNVNVKGKAICKIINSQGQLVLEKEISEADNYVLMDGVSAGVYRILLNDLSGKVCFCKVVKL